MARPDAFIVAEVSKSWIYGVPVSDTPLLAQSFEYVIETNRQRGYRLHSFQLHRLMVSINQLNETIIAVFERVGEPASCRPTAKRE
jgi:tmRNA-binding protein